MNTSERICLLTQIINSTMNTLSVATALVDEDPAARAIVRELRRDVDKHCNALTALRFETRTK